MRCWPAMTSYCFRNIQSTSSKRLCRQSKLAGWSRSGLPKNATGCCVQSLGAVWRTNREKQDETEESERIHQSVLGQSLTVLKNGAPHWPFDNQIRQVSHLFIGFEQEIADMVDGSMMQIMSPAFNSTGTVMESAAFEQRGYFHVFRTFEI